MPSLNCTVQRFYLFHSTNSENNDWIFFFLFYFSSLQVAAMMSCPLPLPLTTLHAPAALHADYPPIHIGVKVSLTLLFPCKRRKWKKEKEEKVNDRIEIHKEKRTLQIVYKRKTGKWVFLERHYRKVNITLTHCIWHVRELIRFLYPSFISISFVAILKWSLIWVQARKKKKITEAEVGYETIECIALYPSMFDAYWSISDFRWIYQIDKKWGSEYMLWSSKRG